MRYVTATEGVDIVLGRQGENEVVTVQFDVTGWAEEYGVGEFLLFNERSKDTAAYPCTATQTGERLDWVIESADVYYSGYGRVQLTYIVNNAVAKSVIYYTVVLPSLDSGDMPTPTPEWIQDVLNYRLDSEAYALGTKNGVAVPDTDPTYHNNSKYFAQIASAIKIYYADGNDTFETIKTAIDGGYLPVTKYSIEYLTKTYEGTAIYGNLVADGSVQQYNLYDVTGYELITIAYKVDNSGASPAYSVIPTIEPMTIDEPTQGSKKYITSGGVYSAIEAVGNLLISKGLITQEEWDER